MEGQTLCEPCARSEFEARQHESPLSVVRLREDSLCAHCATDLDGFPAKPYGKDIICEQCDAVLRNRPFPLWLKVAAVLVGTMMIVSYVYNWRFIQAQLEVKRRDRAIEAGDLQSALKYSANATRLVPEAAKVAGADRQLRAVDDFRKAAAFLNQGGREPEVIRLITDSRVNLPESFQHNAQTILLYAEMALAFDRKDYDQFLAKAQALVQFSSNDATALGALASAQAAKYAATGDEAFKTAALESLEKCKTGLNPRPDFADLADRVNHRLSTREILDRKEFQKRFPKGWAKGQEETNKP